MEQRIENRAAILLNNPDISHFKILNREDGRLYVNTAVKPDNIIFLLPRRDIWNIPAKCSGIPNNILPFRPISDKKGAE